MTAGQHASAGGRRPPARARARVGVFGIGLAAYWPQFDGPARAHRGLPAARRGARRASSAARWSPPASSTPRRARREAGDRFARRPGRPRALPRGDLRDLEQVLPAVQAAKVPVVLLGLQPTPTPRLREHRHRRVAGQLRGLLRAGARGRVHARADPLRHRRRARSTDDERAWAKIGAWVRAAGVARALRRVADRLPRAHLSGHARHVLGLHGRARAARRARRGARDRRPRRARRARPTTPRSTAKEAEIRAMFDFADPSDDPIAGPIERRPARLVGARRGRPRPARRGLRARRADLLLPRRSTATRPSASAPA